MNDNFANKVIVVTGAAGALGSAVSAFFHSQGAKVANLDYSLDVFKQNGISAIDSEQQLFIALDLTERQACAQAAQTIIQRWSRIDCLINIAGGFIMGEAVHETSDKTWDFLFNLNTRSVLNTAAAFVPTMIAQQSGKIVNISAGAAHHGIATMGTYVASKCAVLRLTESMALELRDNQINVNCILPGTIDTARNRSDMPNADFNRWVAPSQIASVIGFLCSDAANAVHGAGIPVTGLS